MSLKNKALSKSKITPIRACYYAEDTQFNSEATFSVATKIIEDKLLCFWRYNAYFIAK